MRKVLEYLEQMNDELISAKDYAESYLQLKVEGDQNWSVKYKTMAEDELRHALNFRELITQSMDKIKAVYTPPIELIESVEKSNSYYVEKVAWIKQMLAM